MSLQRSHYTTEEKHAALCEMRRERARLVENARVAYAKGDAAGAEKELAEVRRLDNIVTVTLKNDPKFAPNGPDALWDFKPIDEEDFMGKKHTTKRTENKLMSTEDKKLEILTEMAKLPPAELAKLKVLAEHLHEFGKLTPRERARILAKAERAGAQVLAKSRVGTPLNPR